VNKSEAFGEQLIRDYLHQKKLRELYEYSEPNDWAKTWWSQRDIFQTSDVTRSAVIQLDLPLPKPKPKEPPIVYTWRDSDLVLNPNDYESIKLRRSNCLFSLSTLESIFM
jgi:hypothetical protein